EPAVVTSDDRTNSVILLAEPTRLVQLEEIARRLDAETPMETTGIHFALLRHRNALDVAKTLTAIYRGGTIDDKQPCLVTAPPPTGPTGGPPPRASISTPVGNEPVIVPDLATNSLLVISDRATFRNLEPIIRRLDRRRPQVFIKASVVEISANDSFD